MTARTVTAPAERQRGIRWPGWGGCARLRPCPPPPAAAPDLDALRARERRGERLKFLFFWGHQPPRGGGLGPACLSQWWPARFTVDGVDYPSAEHYMMAAKARLFGDEATAARVLAAPHPGAAKALGRQVSSFDEATWVAHRYAIVRRASVAKFGQDRELGDYLRTTGSRILVEASPLDRIWGIGLPADDPRSGRPSRWRGLNLLGFALMEARAALGSLPPPARTEADGHPPHPERGLIARRWSSSMMSSPVRN